jgi:bacterioferritin-associated ferredoxin
MIVCSCNAFSDHQVRAAATRAAGQLRMSKIYGCLGFKARCGRCAYTIKQILDEMFIELEGRTSVERRSLHAPDFIAGDHQGFTPAIVLFSRPVRGPNACSIRSRPQ